MATGSFRLKCACVAASVLPARAYPNTCRSMSETGWLLLEQSPRACLNSWMMQPKQESDFDAQERLSPQNFLPIKLFFKKDEKEKRTRKREMGQKNRKGR